MTEMLPEALPGTATSAPADMADEKKSNSKLQKIVHLWEAETIDVLFNGISLAARQKHGDEDNDKRILTPAESIIPSVHDLRVCEKMFCASCTVEFADREDQKEHFKLDWHRFNLKRKLKNEGCVTQVEFEEITSAGDLSSISGSDSSSDDEDKTVYSKFSQHPEEEDEEDIDGGHVEGIGKRHPRIFLRNADGELLSLYRCVVHGKKNQAGTSDELIAMVKQIPQDVRWCVFMLAAGHFAGAVFNGNNVVEHKTFHRYVVRAKRGTVQSTRDSKGHAPKSGGASIRRYNEAALALEIQDLLSTWSAHIKDCSHIFLRAPTYNKTVFFGGKTPVLDKKDTRIRLIPFQTRRPTFKELKRVQELLCSVECYGTESSIYDHIAVSPKKVTVAGSRTDTQTDALDHTSTIQNDFSKKCQTFFKSTENKNDLTDSDSDIITIELTTETLIVDTSHLKPFEISTKSKKKKKKYIPKADFPAEGQPEPFMDSTNLALRNDLYTACKTKDTEMLRTLLDDVKQRKIPTLNKETMHSQDMLNSVTHPADNPTKDNVTCSEVNEGSDIASGASINDEEHFKCLINHPFGDTRITLLHVASDVGHKEAVSILMEMGADPSIKNLKGQVPYISATSKDVRNEFRRFMANFPDMYDYVKAQVPGPLSDELEQQRKSREAERKKVLRKAKKEREKDQKMKEATEREEERETKRYLALSDREKRAIAAEKRLTSQMTGGGQTVPALSRCYQCGTDITGKVPFEYSDYTFCTTKCLREHRSLIKSTSKPS